ncbi:thiamine phosphate synthase [uncultured Bacteroides sp.]|uniref:thiamine phosphate synthase n=1 Tax=uncultured Bacteroides sp. TaxID=162156 RepID=UPI00261B9EAB|nr:thiamine phosphate synthase [uncultured Bacteroides sp.]
MKLILITTPTYFVEEDKILTTLFDEGLDILHLRKPDTAPVYAERLLTLIPEKYRKRIVVHGHFYLKEEYNLRGIHLNHRNPVAPENYSGQISTSCHTLEEVQEQKPKFDYVFLSPIFDSISKEGYASNFTPEQIRAAVKNGIIDKHVMALGGIDEGNILQIKDYGFGGAAILGGLWSKFNPGSDYNYKELIEHFRKLKRLSD